MSIRNRVSKAGGKTLEDQVLFSAREDPIHGIGKQFDAGRNLLSRENKMPVIYLKPVSLITFSQDSKNQDSTGASQKDSPNQESGMPDDLGPLPSSVQGNHSFAGDARGPDPTADTQSTGPDEASGTNEASIIAKPDLNFEASVRPGQIAQESKPPATDETSFLENPLSLLLLIPVLLIPIVLLSLRGRTRKKIESEIDPEKEVRGSFEKTKRYSGSDKPLHQELDDANEPFELGTDPVSDFEFGDDELLNEKEPNTGVAADLNLDDEVCPQDEFDFSAEVDEFTEIESIETWHGEAHDEVVVKQQDSIAGADTERESDCSDVEPGIVESKMGLAHAATNLDQRTDNRPNLQASSDTSSVSLGKRTEDEFDIEDDQMFDDDDSQFDIEDALTDDSSTYAALENNPELEEEIRASELNQDSLDSTEAILPLSNEDDAMNLHDDDSEADLNFELESEIQLNDSDSNLDLHLEGSAGDEVENRVREKSTSSQSSDPQKLRLDSSSPFDHESTEVDALFEDSNSNFFDDDDSIDLEISSSETSGKPEANSETTGDSSLDEDLDVLDFGSDEEFDATELETDFDATIVADAFQVSDAKFNLEAESTGDSGQPINDSGATDSINSPTEPASNEPLESAVVGIADDAELSTGTIAENNDNIDDSTSPTVVRNSQDAVASSGSFVSRLFGWLKPKKRDDSDEVKDSDESNGEVDGIESATIASQQDQTVEICEETQIPGEQNEVDDQISEPDSKTTEIAEVHEGEHRDTLTDSNEAFEPDLDAALNTEDAPFNSPSQPAATADFRLGRPADLDIDDDEFDFAADQEAELFANEDNAIERPAGELGRVDEPVDEVVESPAAKIDEVNQPPLAPAIDSNFTEVDNSFGNQLENNSTFKKEELESAEEVGLSSALFAETTGLPSASDMAGVSGANESPAIADPAQKIPDIEQIRFENKSLQSKIESLEYQLSLMTEAKEHLGLELASMKSQLSDFIPAKTTEDESEDSDLMILAEDPRAKAIKISPDDLPEVDPEIFDRLKQRLNAEYRKRKNAQEFLVQAEEQRNEIAKALRQARNEFKELNSTRESNSQDVIQALESQLSERSEKIKAIEARELELKLLAEQGEQAASSLQEKLTVAESRFAEAETKLAVEESRVNEIASALAEVESKAVESMVAKTEDLDSVKLKLSESESRLSAERASVESELSEKDEFSQQLAEDNKMLTANIQTLKQSNASLDAELQSSSTAMQKLKFENDELVNSVELLESKAKSHEGATQDWEALRNELGQLKASLVEKEKATAEADRWKTNYDSVSQERDAISKQLAEQSSKYDQDREQFKAALEELKPVPTEKQPVEISELNAEAQDPIIENADFDSEIQLRQELRDQEKRIMELESEHHEAIELVQQLTKAKTQAESQLATQSKASQGNNKTSNVSSAKSNKSNGDDLTRISGIGPAIEKKLHNIGVTTFAEIADWTSSDAAEVNRKLSFKDRVLRDGWIEQAKSLVQDTKKSG